MGGICKSICTKDSFAVDCPCFWLRLSTPLNRKSKEGAFCPKGNGESGRAGGDWGRGGGRGWCQERQNMFRMRGTVKSDYCTITHLS